MTKDNLKSKKKEVLSAMLKNIKLEDAGIKPKKHKPMSDCSVGYSSSKTRYPNLYLNIEQAPQLKGYEVGDKVMMVIESEITSHSKNDDMETSREGFDLFLKKIGCQEKNEKKD